MQKFLLLLLCIPLLTRSQLLITNATILDVENQKIIPGRQVLIEGGRITAVGKSVKAPAGVRVIDGTGQFLAPGFVDAHIHFFQSGGIYTRPDGLDLRKYRPYQEEMDWTHRNMENLLRRYVRAGITSVVDVGASLHFLEQRDSFRTKDYASTVYMTGPLLTTWEPDVYKGLGKDEPFSLIKNEEDARRWVREQLPYRPDFIKIWYIIDGLNKDSIARRYQPLVKAVIDEASRNGLRTAVHATEQITARLAVEAGARFLVHGVDDEVVDPSFVQLLKSHNVVLSPTMVVADGYYKAFTGGYTVSPDAFHYAHPAPLNSLIDLWHLPDTLLLKRLRTGMQLGWRAMQKEDSIRAKNLQLLVQGGVTIATGTDAGNIGTQHVASYFEELSAMQAAGMSNWQLLQASTLNGAKAVGREADFGSIAPGKRADLVLLSRNPLDSLGAWKKITAVINKGRWWTPDSVFRPSALEVVDQQALAYNAHSLDLYMAILHDSIQMYELPQHHLDIDGREAARKAYGFLEKTPDLYCRILNRIVEKNMIIDQEEVTFDRRKKPYQGLAMYYVENGKIRKVYFYGAY